MQLTVRTATPLGNNPALAEAWTTFLEQWSWSWFATLTFREETHPEAADKRFRVWISKLNRATHGIRWSKHGRGCYWARALEYQRRGVIHFHALIGGERIADEQRIHWANEWNELAGFARIEVPRGAHGVVSYAAKYTSKGGEIDLGGRLLQDHAMASSVA